MKFCDITMAYNEKSGGIRTYIDEKRRYLLKRTRHEHLLIIPGADDHVERCGRLTTVHVPSPLLPGQDAYRFFLSAPRLRKILVDAQPDVVELGCYYVSPWAAFSYRRRQRRAGKECVVSAFFHTDVAEAYVAAPMRALAHRLADKVAEPAGELLEVAADAASAAAARYMRGVFMAADLRFAPAPAQAARLADYGVTDVAVTPLGVDVNLFHPARRSQALRADLGAAPDDLVLVYAGRFSTEKRIATLIEAFAALPTELRPRLWLFGDGPLRADVEAAAANDPRIAVFDYEADRQRFAAILASADIYLTAGPHETFGLSVIEAQASGRPVVGVAAGALLERVPKGLGALGPVDDGQAMAANIAVVAAARVTMGEAARAHVARRFSWNASLKRLMTHYESALSAPAPARFVN